MKEYLREIVQRAAPRDAVPEGGLPDGSQSVHKGGGQQGIHPLSRAGA